MLSFYLGVISDEAQRRKFEEVYRAHRQAMFCQAQAILHNEADAEDAVHAVFLRTASRHMDRLSAMEDPEDIRNYLLKAVKNTALNEQKRMGRRELSLEDAPELKAIADLKDGDFLGRVTRRAQYVQVLAAIQALAPIYRDVLYDRFVLDMKAPEIAELLDLTVSAVKKRLIRGKKLLLANLNFGEDAIIYDHS